MSKFKSQKELLDYLQGGGVVKPHAVLSQPYEYAKVNGRGRLEYLNGRSASHCLLTIDYWVKADSGPDEMIIDSFKRTYSDQEGR